MYSSSSSSVFVPWFIRSFVHSFVPVDSVMMMTTTSEREVTAAAATVRERHAAAEPLMLIELLPACLLML